jgi:hypothetical protein
MIHYGTHRCCFKIFKVQQPLSSTLNLILLYIVGQMMIEMKNMLPYTWNKTFITEYPIFCTDEEIQNSIKVYVNLLDKFNHKIFGVAG